MGSIELAKYSGFCFGVKRALDITEEEIKKNEVKKLNGKVYTFGPLIHNKNVIEDLKKKGVEVLENLDSANIADIVIIRSHGEGKDFYESGKNKGIKLVDATCPFVKKIHNMVLEADKKNKNVIIVGDQKHPEVKGINGWCHNRAYIINSLEDIGNIPVQDYFVVAQTTIRNTHFNQMIKMLQDKIEKRGFNIEIKNTICTATEKRQKSCQELSQKTDVMIVIGDKKSSNSKKLYELAKKYCEKTYFIENKTDLPLKNLSFCNKIGVVAGASTPERIIKEVIANMSEIIAEKNEEMSMEELMNQIDTRIPRSGDVVNGVVIQVTDREMVVNLGCKKDGIIPKDEVLLEEDQKLTDVFNEGDEIQVKVLSADDGDGNILLSKRKLKVQEHWDEVNEALENKTYINVKVVKVVNGGVVAVYKDIFGFILFSQLSDRFVENPSDFIGKQLDVRVLRVDQKRGKVTFSHKAVLMEERQKKIEEIWGTLSEGDVVEGTVMRFTPYGAFVDIGGLDGLLHISEISWGKLDHPQEVLEIGQTIPVKVLSMNKEAGKISLGLKQTQPEPWETIDERYEVGQVIKGKLVQIKDYGIFVELEPGLDGLVHISEIAHRRIENISSEFSVGQEITAKIIDLDHMRKRLSLSVKATVEPEETAETTTEEAVETAEVEEQAE